MVNTRQIRFISITISFHYLNDISFAGECEQRITDLRARIPAQQNTIRTRRSEKQRLEGEAQRLRAEADSAAIRGQNGMQLGLGNNSRRLLEEGELEIWKKYVS